MTKQKTKRRVAIIAAIVLVLAMTTTALAAQSYSSVYLYATTSSASYYSVQTDTSSKAYPLNARNTLNSSTSGDSCKFYVNFAYQGLGKVTAEYWCQPNGTQYNMAYLSDEVSMLNKTGTLMGRANTNNGTTYVSGSFGAG